MRLPKMGISAYNADFHLGCGERRSTGYQQRRQTKQRWEREKVSVMRSLAGRREFERPGSATNRTSWWCRMLLLDGRSRCCSKYGTVRSKVVPIHANHRGCTKSPRALDYPVLSMPYSYEYVCHTAAFTGAEMLVQEERTAKESLRFTVGHLITWYSYMNLSSCSDTSTTSIVRRSTLDSSPSVCPMIQHLPPTPAPARCGIK